MKYIKLFEKNCLYDDQQKFHDYIQFGNLDKALKLYKSADIDLNYEVGDFTPLTRAIYYDRFHIIDVLIKLGVDINHVDNSGDSPLIYTAYQYKLDAMKMLIDAGADWNIKDNNNNTFLDILDNEDRELIIDDYPEKYKDYLMKKDIEKYNL
jgi:ankyrin repeat protein